jgi:very-short-patch-repair endonuclease
MTDAERRLWNQLRAHRLMKLGFRRQMPIEGYIADFACPEIRLVVEVDGMQHADVPVAHRDRIRTLRLGNAGWTVIRFWNHEIMQNLTEVCDHIVAVAEDAGTFG